MIILKLVYCKELTSLVIEIHLFVLSSMVAIL